MLAGVADGEDLADAGTDAVEDAVGWDDKFADVRAADFRNHAAQTGVRGEGIRGMEKAFGPPPCEGCVLSRSGCVRQWCAARQRRLEMGM